MTKRPKFVRVIGISPRAGDSHEFRRAGDMLVKGTVVPVQWFKTTPDAVFFQLLNPAEHGGYGILEEYEPGTAEMAWLREQYPLAFTTPEPPASQEPKKTRTTSKQEEGE